MRIVFMGTPDFAVPCLERLLADGHQVAGVFTQPDKPKGRGHHLQPPPVKELALARGLPVYQPATLRDGQALETLRALAPQLAVVVAYGKILPPALLAVPPLGCINVHGSLLPRWRGAAPIQWSVLSGDRQAGVTTMYLAEGMDTGDMILRRSTPVGPQETSGQLYERLAELGAQLLGETVELIAQGRAPRTPQQEEEATYAPMLTKELAAIDFMKPAAQVHNLVRGMNPWPVAHTLLEGQPLKVYAARLAKGSGAPGQVLESRGRLVVACGQGAVELLELQAQGKKRMAAADYLRGHPLAPGTVLGI
ncbi:MAG TPA: methionyl-tRNA formyltransferase [Candidatus Anaerotruncus excrementipullorum]|uniref:Methionyl-tRNA formyltransferase n=1 Tax=Candidatus Anaerotruncus excrementipullorum TaxID=2838465 RepID=A0A9D2B851_9FIRM|nr:methionyl-tRNA formyltransferase [Candidatus Anaerotruncus excrementipullorum]